MKIKKKRRASWFDSPKYLENQLARHFFFADFHYSLFLLFAEVRYTGSVYLHKISPKAPPDTGLVAEWATVPKVISSLGHFRHEKNRTDCKAGIYDHMDGNFD